MNCPKCGYERQSRDDAFVPPGECPACGVVYSKHDPADESADAGQQAPAPHLRPSPVDATSLRKARERVEKRLREQQEKRVPDDRRAKTLELAKQLASEELRKRQEEWKLAHAGKEESAPADADEECLAGLSEAESAVEDASAPDHQTQFEDQVADEMMTATAAEMEATADEPATAMDDPPGPADDEEPEAAGYCRDVPESVTEDELENGPLEADGSAAEEETFIAEASVPAAPETEDSEPPSDIPAAHVAAAALPRRPKSGSWAGLSRLLPAVAWLILGAGIIGAVLSWTTINEVQAGAQVPMAGGMNGLPLGLLLGFAYLATGVLGFAFFWVSSLISTQLRDIYHLLQPAEQEEDTLQNEAV
jgi:hypothetical protein